MQGDRLEMRDVLIQALSLNVSNLTCQVAITGGLGLLENLTFSTSNSLLLFREADVTLINSKVLALDCSNTLNQNTYCFASLEEEVNFKLINMAFTTLSIINSKSFIESLFPSSINITNVVVQKLDGLFLNLYTSNLGLFNFQVYQMSRSVISAVSGQITVNNSVFFNLQGVGNNIMTFNESVITITHSNFSNNINEGKGSVKL